MKRRIGEYLQLLAEAGYVTKSELYHSGMKRVEGLTYESGKAGPGTLFVCKGASFRREYLEEAVERGAVCYVSEQDYGLKQVPCILVRNIREVMPLLAESFYQVPPGRSAISVSPVRRERRLRRIISEGFWMSI